MARNCFETIVVDHFLQWSARALRDLRHIKGAPD
jgi:hypothetical protein